MDGASNQAVTLSVAGWIATIKLNRPAALNALNAEMVSGLAEAVNGAGADPSARVVVVTGGDHFMAGGDIKWFKEQLDAEPDPATIEREFEAFIHPVHEVITAMRTMPKPIVAAIRGACAGFGVSLAVACDLAVAADDAFFTLAYCHLGVSPDGGSTFALPRAVGMKRAFEIALLGDRFDAATAKAAGLINQVVPAAEFDAAVAKLAGRLAKGPTHVYGKTKALLNASLGASLAEQLNAEAKSFAECAGRRDFAEGVAAFVEKRPPSFTGE